MLARPSLQGNGQLAMTGSGRGAEMEKQRYMYVQACVHEHSSANRHIAITDTCTRSVHRRRIVFTLRTHVYSAMSIALHMIGNSMHACHLCVCDMHTHNEGVHGANAPPSQPRSHCSAIAPPLLRHCSAMFLQPLLRTVLLLS